MLPLQVVLNYGQEKKLSLKATTATIIKMSSIFKNLLGDVLEMLNHIKRQMQILILFVKVTHTKAVTILKMKAI